MINEEKIYFDICMESVLVSVSVFFVWSNKLLNLKFLFRNLHFLYSSENVLSRFNITYVIVCNK